MHRPRLILLVLAAVGMFTLCPTTTHAQTPPPGSPLALGQHPRIWITEASAPEIKAKLAADMKGDYQQFVAYLDSVIGTAASEGEYALHIRNYAFLVLVGPVPGVSFGNSMDTYAATAVALLKKAIQAGNPSIAVAVGYDWLHSRLTPGERAEAVAVLKKAPIPKDGDNPFHGTRIKPRTLSLIVGLAYAFDVEDDGSGAARLSRYSTQILGPSGSLEAANVFAGDEGGWSSGMSYSANGNTDSDFMSLFMAVEAWRTANALSRAATYGGKAALAFRHYASWVAYSTLPHPTGSAFRLYRTHHMAPGNGVGFVDQRLILASLRMFKGIDDATAGLSQWLIEKHGLQGNSGTVGRRYAMLGNFLFGQKVAAKSPADLGLPLTREFKQQGWFVMRTGLTSDNDTMVTFMASPWSRQAGGYMNLNQGSFTIDRNGPLALNSGAGIHHQYANSAWAHNTIIFPDTTESLSHENWDKGGQRIVSTNLASPGVQWTKGSVWDLGGIQRRERFEPTAGRDYDYVYADVTRAYNGVGVKDSVNTSKVALFSRQMVYFRRQSATAPDYVVVFDRTASTRSTVEKRWLLHTSSEPVVQGAGTLEREGKWVYQGAGLVTSTNTSNGSSGRLFSQTLLPLNRRVVKIGGPGHEFEDPYGVNNPNSIGTDPQFVGQYRVEVIPNDPGLEHVFMHVLEATGVGTANPTPAILLKGTGMYGARVGSKIAAFGATEQRVQSANLVIDTSGNVSVLLSDLVRGGEYAVSLNGASQKHVASAAGTLYLKLVVSQANSTLSVSSTGVVIAVDDPDNPEYKEVAVPKNLRVAP